MASMAEEANVTFTDVNQTVREMRKWSKVLRPPSKSLEHSLNTILRANEVVVGWGSQIKDYREGLGDAGA